MHRPQTERVPVRRVGPTADLRSAGGTVDPEGRDVDDVIVEEPLAIHLDDTLVTTTMRTPGHDFELAVGFCFTDGLLAGAAVTDVRNVVDGDGTPLANAVAVDTDGRAPTPTPRLGTTSSSCGWCGSDRIDDLYLRLAPVGPFDPIEIGVLAAVPDAVRPHQRLFASTGSVHGAAVFDRSGAVHLVREDVGRHNAVDKVVGRLVLDGALPSSEFGLFVSGRASIEMVQKAWAAGFGTVLAVSAPTSLAVDGAHRAGITLAGFVRDGRLNVYSPARR